MTELLHTHTVLEGDYNLYAVIHWSGLKKSNVVFILTFNYSDVSIQFIYQQAFSLNVLSSDILTNESLSNLSYLIITYYLLLCYALSWNKNRPQNNFV